MAEPELSVVLLCYRLGSGVRSVVEKMEDLLKHEIPSYQLVLVGNYNNENDETPKIVTELAEQNPHIVATAKKKQGMMGWDMKSGLALATGHYIAVIDGDGQMPFEDVVAVYREMKKVNADLGKTFRTVRGDDAWRKIVSYLYNFLFHILFPGLNSRDMNSKPKIFSRRALAMLRLQSDDWFIDAEIMIQARRHHFSIVELPTVFRKLQGRQSFVKFPTIFEFLKNLVVYRIQEFNAARHS